MAAMATVCVAGAQTRDGRLREALRARLAERRVDPGVVTVRDPRARLPGPGDYRFEVLHDGVPRLYRVHVPRSYREGAPTPLLVALHGGMGDMDRQADEATYGLVGASERYGFVAVFPNGFSRFPGGRFATWNAGRCCGPARDAGIDDVGFIRRVVADVERQVSIDPRRVYATGMSNGGMMAYRLACEAADVFRAIAPVAGTDNTLACRPKRPVAVLHLHARDDDHVRFEGGAGERAFGNRASITDYVSVPATVAKWTALDGCAAPANRVLDVPGAYCELHAPCAGGAQVQLCVTASGGHSWPGADRTRGAPASQAIAANDVMWRFFQSL